MTRSSKMAKGDEDHDSDPDFGYLIAAPTSKGYLSQPSGYLQRLSARARGEAMGARAMADEDASEEVVNKRSRSK
jgi:hypothetical protein